MALVKCMECGKRHGSLAPAGVLLEDWMCDKCGGLLGMYVSLKPAAGRRGRPHGQNQKAGQTSGLVEGD